MELGDCDSFALVGQERLPCLLGFPGGWMARTRIALHVDSCLVSDGAVLGVVSTAEHPFSFFLSFFLCVMVSGVLPLSVPLIYQVHCSSMGGTEMSS